MSDLPQESLRVLRVLRSKSSPGFEVMSKAGLGQAQEFVDALNPLLERGLIRITGETYSGSALRDAVFSIPLRCVGAADIVLGKTPPRIILPRPR